MASQKLHKFLLNLDFSDFEPQIAAQKYITTTHLSEYSTSFLYVEIIVYNCAFFKYH